MVKIEGKKFSRRDAEALRELGSVISEPRKRVGGTRASPIKDWEPRNNRNIRKGVAKCVRMGFEQEQMEGTGRHRREMNWKEYYA